MEEEDESWCFRQFNFYILSMLAIYMSSVLFSSSILFLKPLLVSAWSSASILLQERLFHRPRLWQCKVWDFSEVSSFRVFSYQLSQWLYPLCPTLGATSVEMGRTLPCRRAWHWVLLHLSQAGPCLLKKWMKNSPVIFLWEHTLQWTLWWALAARHNFTLLCRVMF